MASSSVIIPVVEPATPIRYFTLPLEDYDTVTQFLQVNNLTYDGFFASYINHLIKLAQSRKIEKAKGKESEVSFEFAQLWIFEELEQTSKNPKPVNVSGLIDAMSEYAKEHWAYGATTGDIPVGNGAVAAREEIEKAEKKLANILWPGQYQRKFLELCPELEWLLSKGEKGLLKDKKEEKRAVNKAAGELESMALDETIEDEAGTMDDVAL